MDWKRIDPLVAKARPPRPLAEALAYENEMVPAKFRQMYDVSRQDADEIFTETKRFLWLVARAYGVQTRPPIFLHNPIAVIDEMWHTFILFTPEYHEYCETFLGCYVHHTPTTEAEITAWATLASRDPDAYRNMCDKRFREMLAFISQELGPGTIDRWYSAFPQKYSLRFLDSRRKSLEQVSSSIKRRITEAQRT